VYTFLLTIFTVAEQLRWTVIAAGALTPGRDKSQTIMNIATQYCVSQYCVFLSDTCFVLIFFFLA
jgi:hypothetical protein